MTTISDTQPKIATSAQVEQYLRIEKKVSERTKAELQSAYFGKVADTGKHLTPFQLAEIAAGVARAAVLNVFAADGRDARDA